MPDTFSLRFSPLQSYTDAVYRQAHARFFGGVDCYYSPFARVEHGEIRRKDLRDIAPEANTGLHLIPQLIAPDAPTAARLLTLFAETGWQEANLNLGCPFPLLARRHNGAGILPHPDEVERLLVPLCEQFPQLRLSVKLRLGWDDASECLALLPLFNRLPLADITLHPRLGRQQYKGTVDLDGFRAFYDRCEKPLFYNGDLLTPSDISRLREAFPRLSGVLLGRGLLARPSLALEYIRGRALEQEEMRNALRGMHDELFRRYSEQLQGGDHQVLAKMKTLWDYLCPDADRKARKTVLKATRLADYLAAVNRLLAL